MNYAEMSKKKLNNLKKEARKKLIVSFIALVFGVVLLICAINESIPFGIGILGFIFCAILSLINTFYISFIKIAPIDKELMRRTSEKKSKIVNNIVPSNCNTTVTLVGSNIRDMNAFGYGLKKKATYYIWKAEDQLFFFPTTISDINNGESALCSMQMADIICYETVGELYHENKISGGGGSRVSVAGALVGNAIGGAAGAVLLGNKGPKSIHSRDIVHDTRAVCLRLSHQREIHFSFGDYATFNIIIPEKNAESILNSSVSTSKSSTASTGVEEIKEYKKLLDDGIITQEEFDMKKKQIMGL